jgi:hypothetical protein
LKLKPVKVGILLIFAMTHLLVYGQRPKLKNESWYDEKKLHFGFSLGINAMDLKITPSQEYFAKDSLFPDIANLKPGINIQAITDLRLARHFSLRFLPGVSFGQRMVTYYKNGEVYNDKQKLESSFLEFPLSLKMKGERMNNVRPYLITGLNFRYDLASKKSYNDENNAYIRLKKPSFYYEAGPGIDFYLPSFKLSVELKMSNGIGNNIVKEPASVHPEFRNAIEKVRPQIWIISFHFE